MRIFTRSSRPSGFSLHELLVVTAVIGITTLIAVPAVTSLSTKAASIAAKRNAQLLASVAANAKASGDPILRYLQSKPAILAYLTADGYVAQGQFAKVDVQGLAQRDVIEAARFLSYSPTHGSLVYHASAVSAAGMTDFNQTDLVDEMSRWNAQLLEGAAHTAAAQGHVDALASAGDTDTALTFLVDVGLGGPMVAGMSSSDRAAAAPYLHYSDGTLSYQP